MNRFWNVAQAGLLFMDPERAHETSLRALEAGVFPRAPQGSDARLVQTIFGLKFPNPVGVAAGYDKDARVYNALFSMGFGFAEAGTITPKPQGGNPKPRVFRLMRERGIINRLGFNSAGHNSAITRIASAPPRGILGINLGANKDSVNTVGDYVRGVAAFGAIASYLAINISSPNTPGLRDLQAPDRLNTLLDAVMGERQRLALAVPVLVKLAPDIHDGDIGAIVRCLLAHKVDGAILTNTTLARDGVSPGAHRGETGGLSGKPLFARSTRMLARVYLESAGKLPLVGVGGVDSGSTAVAKFRAGASLLQVYTGLVYEGAGLISEINRSIAHELSQTSLSLKDIIGSEAVRMAHETG